MKKLLIYAHYYAPDVASTGQILKELAEGLVSKFEITVICVVPSYTGKIEERYKKDQFYIEELNGIKIIRVRVPEFDKKNKLSRIKNILSYYFGALKATEIAGKQDYILSVSQPPILGGLLGVFGTKKQKEDCKFIYQIQDFNPEQINAVGYIHSKLLLSLLLKIDKFSCRNSDLIITVGRDLVRTVETRFKGQKQPKVCMINNWINEKEIFPLNKNNRKVVEFKKKHGLDDKFIIMYSGNIGLYYDLENLIKVIEKFPIGTKNIDGKEVAFVFVGDGSVATDLKNYVKINHLTNVSFIPYQKKEDLIYSLNAGDIHWCVNAKGIKGISCPSKAYGIMAAGKPIIGVLEEGTEVRGLIEDSRCGKCVEPGDYLGIEGILKWYINNVTECELESMGQKGRDYLVKNLTKEMSIKRYADEILNL